jgi:hypothetical protein
MFIPDLCQMYRCYSCTNWDNVEYRNPCTERYTFDRKENGSRTQSDHSTEITVWKQTEE